MIIVIIIIIIIIIDKRVLKEKEKTPAGEVYLCQKFIYFFLFINKILIKLDIALLLCESNSSIFF